MKKSSWIAIEMLRKTFPCRVYVSFNPHDDILLMYSRFASWAAPIPLVDFSTSPLSASNVILNPGMSILLTISTVVSTCSIQIGGNSGTKHPVGNSQGRLPPYSDDPNCPFFSFHTVSWGCPSQSHHQQWQYFCWIRLCDTFF